VNEGMHVEVITRHAVRNYGSVLQAFATKLLLAEAGADPRFVDYRQPGYDDTGWSVANRGSMRGKSWPLRAAYAGLRDAGTRRIGRAFQSFVDAELTVTDRVYRSLPELERSTEFSGSAYYCAGSDQVWNVEYNVDNRPYYLDFAPRGARKFSLASSIGAASLPPDEERRLVDALQRFAGVSVREQDAAEYLHALGVGVEQHVDPTLAISADTWRTFAGPSTVGAPYIAVYQLNEMDGFRDVVDVVSSRLGLPVKRIEYWRGPRSRHHPSEILPTVLGFVALIRDSAFVVTDSFHGSVFATQFGRPFVAVAPPRYAGRISSLLDLIGEPQRLVQDADQGAGVATGSSLPATASIVLEREQGRVREYLGRIVGTRPTAQ